MMQLMAMADATRRDTAFIGWIVGEGLDALACERIARDLRNATAEQLRPAIAYLSDEAGYRARQVEALHVERARVLATCRSLSGSGAKRLVANPFMNRTAVAAMRMIDLQLALTTEEDAARRAAISAELAAMAADKTQPFVSIMAPPAQASLPSTLQHRAMRRLYAGLLACRAFEADAGHLPASLEELVPKYLPAVPKDPYAADGSAIRYDAAKKKLYTIGKDGVDNGGDIVPPPPKNPEYSPDPWSARDYGFSLAPDDGHRVQR